MPKKTIQYSKTHTFCRQRACIQVVTEPLRRTIQYSIRIWRQMRISLPDSIVRGARINLKENEAASEHNRQAECGESLPKPNI